jgi:hypothetical protein
VSVVRYSSGSIHEISESEGDGGRENWERERGLTRRQISLMASSP